MRNPVIRPATLADAAPLSALTTQVFTATYGAQIPPEMLKRYLAATASPAAIAASLGQSNTLYLGAWQHDQLLGLSKLVAGAPALPVAGEQPVELAKLYVDPRYHGQGVAAQLLQATLVAAAQLGYDRLWLCVWQENRRALAFYHKWGFAVVGELPVWVESVVFDDWVMVKEIINCE
jgi:diamine N-acetyltransferase